MIFPTPPGTFLATIHSKNWGELLKGLIRHPLRHLRNLYVLIHYWLTDFETCKEWNCPVLNPFRMILSFPFKEWIVVYHQEVYGDFLGATNRVRWFTHNPGYFTGAVYYLPNELYFRYADSFGRDFVPPIGSHVSKNFLNISSIPECYNAEDINEERSGTAYFLRKGKKKTIVHNLSDSILLDGKTHDDVAKALKKVKMLISYDSVTAYSFFALLCHCPSVVILGEDETPDTYRPNKEEQQKYAYSIDEVDIMDWNASFQWAEKTAQNAKTKSFESVKSFVEESQEFFYQSTDKS